MRRIQSKSKRNPSPKEANYNSIISAPKIMPKKSLIQQGSPPNAKSTSKSKQSDLSKSNQ